MPRQRPSAPPKRSGPASPARSRRRSFATATRKPASARRRPRPHRLPGRRRQRRRQPRPSRRRPGESKREHGVYTLTRNVDEVVLNCTVVDNDGHLVQDLQQGDFHVFEDNAPQNIVAFSHSDVPVSLGILVDNSGSMRDKRAAVNTAALDLVRASNPEDEAFIVNFSDEAFLDQDFTSDINKLREGLSHIESRGGTALYDAVVASADQLAHGARRPKQVLLIITDGEDNASTLNLEQTDPPRSGSAGSRRLFHRPALRR